MDAELPSKVESHVAQAFSPAQQIAAIIPNWNGATRLGATLDSLSKQTHPITHVIVVDNGSADNSTQIAESSGARVVRLDRNYGFARAVNRGIDSTDEPYVLILNNDVVLAPDYVQRLLSAAVGNSWFAVGKIVNAAGDLLDGSFDLLSRGGSAWRAGSGRTIARAWDIGRIVRFPPLTAAAVNRELFARVGKLDERFESYLEDVDFGLRCASKGYTGVYVPSAVAYHIGSATLGRWHARTVRQIARNQLLVVAKHYPPAILREFGWHIAVAQTLWAFVAVRHGRGLSWVQGKLEGLRLFRSCRGTGDAVVRDILRDSEQELLALQCETGFDLYWRLYFALTR